MKVTDLISDEGFLRAFYALLADASRAGRKITQEDAFDELDGLYFEAFGVHRFKSFGAFRKRRDRNMLKKR